jgi:transposase
VRKQISFDKENDILFGLLKGCSMREVAQQMHVCQSSVQRIRQKHLLLMEVSVGGRPTKVSEGMRKACVSAVIVGSLDSATQATKFVNEQMQENVNVQTVRRILQAIGLQARAKTKKPLLQEKNVRARLRFAEEHKKWIVADWKHVIFTDETKINRFGSDGRTWC